VEKCGVRRIGWMNDLLIFDPVTGRSGGKTKRTVVRITYARPIYTNQISSSLHPFFQNRNKKRIKLTRLAVHPITPPSLNGLESGNIFRARIQFIAIGIPYETPSATTEAEMIALNALFPFISIYSNAPRRKEEGMHTC
jgi:hypothetical protein